MLYLLLYLLLNLHVMCRSINIISKEILMLLCTWIAMPVSFMSHALLDKLSQSKINKEEKMVVGILKAKDHRMDLLDLISLEPNLLVSPEVPLGDMFHMPLVPLPLMVHLHLHMEERHLRHMVRHLRHMVHPLPHTEPHLQPMELRLLPTVELFPLSFPAVSWSRNSSR
jgi:hypothetical protein